MSSKSYGTRSSNKKTDAATVARTSVTKGKPGKKSAKADQVVDSGTVAGKRKSLSSSKVVNPLLITAVHSSDSESDDSSASASHASKRLAKADAAAAAAETKRRQDEEALRKEKMTATVSAKLADPADDGLMTINEINAVALPNSVRPLFPIVAAHRNTDMGPLMVKSLQIIKDRPNAAIFHGSYFSVVRKLREGSLVFLARARTVQMPAVGASSSSSLDDIPITVSKDVILVEVYQLYTPPDPLSGVRLGRVLATNAPSPGGLLGSSVGSNASEGMMDPTEFVSVLFGMESEVYVMVLSNWQFLLQMLGPGGFRAWPDVVNGVFLDPFKRKLHKFNLTESSPDQGSGDDNDHESSDSDVDDDPSRNAGGVADKGLAALGGGCSQSDKVSLTAPSADQISFGLPEQHHLTSVASLALAKRLSKKKSNNEEHATLTLGKSTNMFKLSYLGMTDLVAEAVSYVPSVALNNNINDLASQISDRVKAPICTVFLVSMVKSWQFSFHPKSLFNFIPFVIHKGSLNSEIALRKFEQFTKVDGDLEPEYLKLIDEHRIPEANISISMVETAAQNYLLCIFILWEMRLDIQDEMLRSVQRLFDWLREHSVSSDNSAMIAFCLCACVEFFRDWDRFRRLCRNVTYDGMSSFLQQEGSVIPSTGPQSLIYKIYIRFSLTDSSFPLASLINGVSGQDVKNAAVTATPVNTPSKTEANKARKLLNKNNKAAAALLKATIPVVTKPVAAQPVPPGIVLNTSGKQGVCAWFSSTDGCLNGAACTREHVVPVKGTIEWQAAETFMKRRKLTPTVAFSQ